MTDALPSRIQLQRACEGTVVRAHPILLAAYELTSLCEAADVGASASEIDCARARLVHDIDRWVCANAPQPAGAAYLHTETVGMIVERLARYYAEARKALERGADELTLHYLWQRTSEIALAYADLAFEVSIGRRRLPDLTDPAAAHTHPDR
jgi:hypothetical protein